MYESTKLNDCESNHGNDFDEAFDWEHCLNNNTIIAYNFYKIVLLENNFTNTYVTLSFPQSVKEKQEYDKHKQMIFGVIQEQALLGKVVYYNQETGQKDVKMCLFEFHSDSVASSNHDHYQIIQIQNSAYSVLEGIKYDNTCLGFSPSSPENVIRVLFNSDTPQSSFYDSRILSCFAVISSLLLTFLVFYEGKGVVARLELIYWDKRNNPEQHGQNLQSEASALSKYAILWLAGSNLLQLYQYC